MLLFTLPFRLFARYRLLLCVVVPFRLFVRGRFCLYVVLCPLFWLLLYVLLMPLCVLLFSLYVLFSASGCCMVFACVVYSVVLFLGCCTCCHVLGFRLSALYFSLCGVMFLVSVVFVCVVLVLVCVVVFLVCVVFLSRVVVCVLFVMYFLLCSVWGCCMCCCFPCMWLVVFLLLLPFRSFVRFYLVVGVVVCLFFSDFVCVVVRRCLQCSLLCYYRCLSVLCVTAHVVVRGCCCLCVFVFM